MASDMAEQPAGPSTADRLVAAGAWAVWLAAVAASLLGMAIGIASQSTPNPTLPQSVASIVAAAAIALTYASVGLLLRLRRPTIVIGWLFLGIGLVSGFGAILWNYVWLSESLGAPPGPINGIQAAMINEVLVVPGWAVLLFMLILLFPNGHLVDRAWRPVLALAIVISGIFAITLGLNPGPLLFFPIYVSPIAPTGLGGDVMTAITAVTTIAIIALGVAAVWSMVVRYRRSDIHGRHQLKWLAWGSSLAVVGGIILLTVASRTFDPRTNAADLSWLVFAAGSMALPVAALIAILREGLYDIDQVIGRTFVFGVLTAILAGLYAASIRLFNALFVGLTGQSNELALVLTTLILATTFTPIKQRLEKIAERRFKTERNEGAPASSAVSEAGAETGPSVGSMTLDDLDQRFEAIARRVSQEVLAASSAADGAAQDQQPDHDQHERAEEVAEARETRPQA